MNTAKNKGCLRSIFLLSLAVFCGCEQATTPVKTAEEPPREVKVIRPHRGEVYRYINLPGEVQPLYHVTLFAKVDGYLENLTVDKGDSVKTGDLIADIDVPELRAHRVKYKAEVELAEAELKQISETITNSTAIAVAKGKLAVAKGNFEYTEAMLNYARITAPFDGIITRRYVDPGAYIPIPNAADTPEAAAIVDVTDFKTLRMQVAVPEFEVPHIALGQPIQWTTDVFPGQSFDGTVTRAYWALDRATRTMLTEMQMTNPGVVLRPGMLVNARIGLEKKADALLIPVAALVREKAGSFVFAFSDGKAKKLPVKTGFNDGTNVEIVSGVNSEDSVIFVGQLTLREGQLLKILDAR